MIALSPQLIPSELLYFGGLPEFFGGLVERSRSLRRTGRLLEAERTALDAVNASREAGVHVGEGVALIHLADVRRRMCRLGPALVDCRKAYLIFQGQPSRYRYHNEAVAAYALGLVHHLLGNDTDALKWYEESDQLLERAEREWSIVNAPDQVEKCASVRQWVGTLSKHLAACRSHADTNFARVCVPIFLDGDGEKFTIAELEVEKYTVSRKLTIDGEAFRTHSIKGKRGRVTLVPGVDCYALQIPPEALKLLDADQGDYALVVQGRGLDKEGPGVVRKPDGLEFGNFERDEERNISFVGLKAAVVIGGKNMEDDLEVGHITALLRPVSPPQKQSAPSSSIPPQPGPPSPPPEPSPASPPESSLPLPLELSDVLRELYDELLSMVGGDRETADRLIEYEREREPDADLLERINSAITRLARDRG